MTPSYARTVYRSQYPTTDALPWTFLVYRDGALLLAGAAATEREATDAASWLIDALTTKRGR